MTYSRAAPSAERPTLLQLNEGPHQPIHQVDQFMLRGIPLDGKNEVATGSQQPSFGSFGFGSLNRSTLPLRLEIGKYTRKHIEGKRPVGRRGKLFTDGEHASKVLLV